MLESPLVTLHVLVFSVPLGALTFSTGLLILTATAAACKAQLPGKTYWETSILLGRQTLVAFGLVTLLQICLCFSFLLLWRIPVNFYTISFFLYPAAVGLPILGCVNLTSLPFVALLKKLAAGPTKAEA
jgi:hypothetical protein